MRSVKITLVVYFNENLRPISIDFLLVPTQRLAAFFRNNVIESILRIHHTFLHKIFKRPLPTTDRHHRLAMRSDFQASKFVVCKLGHTILKIARGHALLTCSTVENKMLAAPL